MPASSPPSGSEFRVRARAPLPPDVVRRLTRLSPLRSTLSLLQTWALVALFVGAALRVPHPAVIALCIVGLAAQQHALAILAHQSAHYRLYETRWLNDLAGRLCAVPIGLSLITYRALHRLHHNNLYSPLDPDLAQMAGYPRGRAYLARKLLKDLLGLTTLKNYLYFFGRPQRSADAAPGEEAARPLDDTSPALRAQAARDRALVLACNAALLAALALTSAFRWYLLLWVLPLVTVLQVLLRLRAVLEHGAPTDTSSPLTAARTTLAPAWARFLLYPHQMHFHIEHHLYPAIPHYRLAEAHRALREHGALQGAEVVPTLGAALAKVFAEPRRA